jgi:hypothetical protein
MATVAPDKAAGAVGEGRSVFKRVLAGEPRSLGGYGGRAVSPRKAPDKVRENWLLVPSQEGIIKRRPSAQFAALAVSFRLLRETGGVPGARERCSAESLVNKSNPVHDSVGPLELSIGVHVRPQRSDSPSTFRPAGFQ